MRKETEERKRQKGEWEQDRKISDVEEEGGKLGKK